MPTCSNCGEDLPLAKSLSGGSIRKNQECPECGTEVTPDHDRTLIQK